MNKTIRILNFDGSLIKQKNLLSSYENRVVDLTHLAAQARYWISAKTRLEIEKIINQTRKNSITFLGSGDFHHISEILISQFEEPLCVISFDFHPDWDIQPAYLNCGSWVSRILKKNNILKVVLLGASSDDISSGGIMTGNLDSLRNNRLEIYPYSHGPTAVFGRSIPENISIRLKKGLFSKTICWSELKNMNLNDFFMDLLKRIPVKNVYVSIDRDCLTSDYALTNWEEGKFSLDELLLLLKLIKENMNIIGLDVTGDYSDILVKGVFKNMLSYLDHPKNIKSKHFPESETTKINEDTNLKIMQLLSS